MPLVNANTVVFALILGSAGAARASLPRRRQPMLSDFYRSACSVWVPACAGTTGGGDLVKNFSGRGCMLQPACLFWVCDIQPTGRKS